MELERYSIRVVYDNMFKDLHFQAENSQEMKNKWKEARKKLNKIGDSADDEHDFLIKAIKNFKEHGFQQIRL